MALYMQYVLGKEGSIMETKKEEDSRLFCY